MERASGTALVQNWNRTCTLSSDIEMSQVECRCHRRNADVRGSAVAEDDSPKGPERFDARSEQRKEA